MHGKYYPRRAQVDTDQVAVRFVKAKKADVITGRRPFLRPESGLKFGWSEFLGHGETPPGGYGSEQEVAATLA